jgi:hypothetical protein
MQRMRNTRKESNLLNLVISIGMIFVATLFIILYPTKAVFSQSSQPSQTPVTSGTETSYLVDSLSGAALSEDGELLGDVTVLPNGDVFRAEVDRLYKAIFGKTMDVSSDIRIATRNREQKYHQRYTAGAKRYSPEVDSLLSQKHLYNHDDEENNISNGSGNSDYVDGPTLLTGLLI